MAQHNMHTNYKIRVYYRLNSPVNSSKATLQTQRLPDLRRRDESFAPGEVHDDALLGPVVCARGSAAMTVPDVALVVVPGPPALDGTAVAADDPRDGG